MLADAARQACCRPTQTLTLTLTQADAAKEAYDAVASGVDLNASSRRSSSDAGAASTQPAEPVGRITCYLCTMVFGVPSGARHVLC